jgi:uncharacterized membrane protein
MWSRFTLFVMAAMAIGFAKTGDLALTSKVVAWLSPIFLLASYFSSRLGAVATRSEKLVAYGWLAVRRFFCFAGAVLFFAVAVTTVVVGPLELDRLVGAAGLGALSVYLAWAGIFGEGRDSHHKRMARYDPARLTETQNE